jgi:hypothetical protein
MEREKKGEAVPALPTTAGPADLPPVPGANRLAVRPAGEPGRWHLMRDVLVFQAKLFVDGLKDIVLAPVSVVAAMAGLLLNRRYPGRSFYEVLRMGRSFDRWINLFGAVEDEPRAAVHDGSQSGRDDGIDAYVRRVETMLVEQHRRGGLTAKAKQAIDRALDAVHSNDVSTGSVPPHPAAPSDRVGDPPHGARDDGATHR